LRRLPHTLTLLRIAASPLLVWLLLQGRFRIALGISLIAGLSDWFDGYLARRLGAAGKLGEILDPLADKILLLTLFLALGALRLIPLWMLSLAIGRDLIIVGGALVLRIFRGARRFVPSTLGKVSTFFQILLVLLALVYASYRYELFFWLNNAGLVLSAIFTGLSGIGYIRLGIRMARAPAADFR